MIGDVIGKPGREAVEQLVACAARARARVDLVVANGENLAGGMGLTASTAAGLYRAGVDVITSGNHIWDKREIYPELDRDERILRPINYGTNWRAGSRLGRLPRRSTAPRSPSSTPRAGRTWRRSRTRSRCSTSCSTSGADELPPVRAGRLPLRADQREERVRHLPRRPRQLRSAARTRTLRRPTSGSCRAARPTSPTSA